MSKKNTVRFVLLCEDKQHEAFASRYLKARGISNWQITSKTAPSGRGSAENFVRRNYAQEVGTYRQKSSYGSGGLALIVIIDADRTTVQYRLQQLDEELSTSRQPNEKIAVIVSKRNIETWIHYIRGTDVDEEVSYRKLDKESDCKDDVKKLATQICPSGLPGNAPPSLFTACEELKRILN